MKNSNEGEDIVRKPTTCLSALALGIAGAISAAAPSFADPITYTLQFIGTGSLGSSSFMNVPVTLQFVGDTGNISNVSGFYVNELGTASVSVNGGAFEILTDPIAVYSNPSADLGPVTVGFTDLNSVDIIDDQGSAFTGYALGPTGPIVGGTLILGGASDIPTESGDLFNLTGVTYNDPNFPGSPTFATVPVPAPPIGRGLPVALAVSGLLLCARSRKRHRCRQRLAPLT
jgi:hypothetical protein